MKKLTTTSINSQIVAARADGLSYAEIGKRLGMTRQGVHQRLQALMAVDRQPHADTLTEQLLRTNRLLAGVIVQVIRLQTTRAAAPVEVLTGLGLSVQEIAEATGTTVATVSVTKHRARKSAIPSNEVTVQ